MKSRGTGFLYNLPQTQWLTMLSQQKKIPHCCNYPSRGRCITAYFPTEHTELWAVLDEIETYLIYIPHSPALQLHSHAPVGNNPRE